MLSEQGIEKHPELVYVRDAIIEQAILFFIRKINGVQVDEIISSFGFYLPAPVAMIG